MVKSSHKKNYFDQRPRREIFRRKKNLANKDFNYDLEYRHLDLRKNPHLYRVGVGEQGVLLVEPYKSEILPYWKFATPEKAKKSSQQILKLFHFYRKQKDLIGMDMARKYLQMGYTRARRYANHSSGRKYSKLGKVLPLVPDQKKAASAEIFYQVWKKVEANPTYSKMKQKWKKTFG